MNHTHTVELKFTDGSSYFLRNRLTGEIALFSIDQAQMLARRMGARYMGKTIAHIEVKDQANQLEAAE